MCSRESLRRALALYAVTDRSWLEGRSLADCVGEALAGGATFLQLREKDTSHDDIVRRARTLRPLARAAGVPFVIDDDVEAARVAGADGVHVGQSDAACAEARALLGSEAIVGVSAGTVEQALAAQSAGADYLGVGAMFDTSTKRDASVVGIAGLRRIVEAVDIPVVAIGGLNLATIPALAGTGADGVAVVSGIFAADDIRAATEELLALTKETLCLETN